MSMPGAGGLGAMRAMPRRIVLIQGHPDATSQHLCHALGASYAAGARRSGHELREIRIAQLDFDLLRRKEDYERGALPPALQEAQRAIAWADHLLIVYPLWQGCMPALLKGFFEQVLRPGFAYRLPAGGEPGARLLQGKSARLVVTMGMPAPLYRWYFGAHGVRLLRRSILGLCGVGPVGVSLLGGVEGRDGRQGRWIERMQRLGERAA